MRHFLIGFFLICALVIFTFCNDHEVDNSYDSRRMMLTLMEVVMEMGIEMP